MDLSKLEEPDVEGDESGSPTKLWRPRPCVPSPAAGAIPGASNMKMLWQGQTLHTFSKDFVGFLPGWLYQSS